jgi:DNA-binding MarR family transcriptional regulator
MSKALTRRQGNERPANTVVLLREAFITLNNRVVVRLAECGHAVVRPAHGAVFQYLDGAGTSVARLAERAQMTKQAMAELVIHLEKHGYVVRRPDPEDRRAKLVVPTRKGMEVFAIAQELIPEIEREIDTLVGPRRAAALRADLDRLRRIDGDSMRNR